MKRSLRIRTDADDQIGYGHIMRTLSLAEMLKEDFDVTFDLIKYSSLAIRRLKENAFTHSLFNTDEEYLGSLKESDLILCDGYHFSDDFYSRIKEKSKSLILIDDYGIADENADIVINHCISDSQMESSTNGKTLLGPSYALVHPDFHSLNSGLKNDEILVCLGSGIEKDEILAFLFILQNKYPNHRIVNLSNQDIKDEDGMLDENRIRLVYSASRQQIIELMQSCDFAICSASTVSLEFLFSHKKLFVIQTVENQENTFQFLVDNRLALDYYNSSNQEIDKKLLSSLFDGKQAERLVNEIKSIV